MFLSLHPFPLMYSQVGKHMIIAVASYKGGVGKTTTAVHLAAYLQTLAPTLLLDGDDTRNATAWGKRGPGFPFRIADEKAAAKLARDFAHTVIDTGQRPTDADLQALTDACDLLVVPAVPASLDSDGLVLTVNALQAIGSETYRVLLTKVPPPPEQEGVLLRAELERGGFPVFASGIPRLKAFEKAAAAGTTVNDVDDSRAGRAWDAYQDVGREVLKYERK